MSTYVYLVCLDHDPPLVAEDESGQHLYDLPRIRSEVADREATAKDAHLGYGYDGDMDAYLHTDTCGCADKVVPGSCGDPSCPVLHADPANPIHPPA